MKMIFWYGLWHAGTVSVAHASFGWTKPVLVEGVTLKGVDGQTVVSVPKIETQASLWSIVSGKTGLGKVHRPPTRI